MPEQKVASTRQAQIRQGAVLVGLAALVIAGTVPYTPARLQAIQDRYGFSQVALDPFRTPVAKENAPALIILHAAQWKDYGVYLHLQDPYLTSSFVFAWAGPGEDLSDLLDSYFPKRTIYHYYPDRPGEFFAQPLP
jgi:hypothetical protein